MDQDSISITIYVHDVDNPPATGHSINVKINLINSKYITISDWNADSDQQSLTLKIAEPISLGLQDFQDYNVEKFIDKVQLACNLVLKNAVFSRNMADTSHSKVERKSDESQKTKAKVSEPTSGHKVVVVQETVRITERVHITVGFEDELDETRVIEILQKINELENPKLTTNFQIQDLNKSLEEYSAAMSSFDRVGIFKHLFSSLELATNCDGNDRKAAVVDKEVNKITGISDSEVKDWREFNARLKHIDRSPQDEAVYQEGLRKIGEKINPLRDTAEKVIVDRLQKI